ncbi:GGDEF domain-containing protein [Shewanella violacea]|uniref:GGDEF domain protein n=1 Tax=Shewanella violacea (strain JCM 10179 / CIP 106290 / LMG 19151 / DSS12) TaxID=637905 RepID=D4ZG81_SHEVD|nr:GGDEF domain-containing protein [Shewanella violacea]BAJ00680.1 GGDEF domain protein [Shewanella violacea DSS12]
MLAQSNHHRLWLREQDHPAISLPRWQQQMDLLTSFYRSQTSLILQLAENSFQVVCTQQSQDYDLSAGTTFFDAPLLKLIQSQSGYGQFHVEGNEFTSSLSQFQHLICQLIYWPDGELFGCILICDPHQNKFQERLAPLVETTKSLIQAELKHLFLMMKVQILSVQDEQTSMLNQYGFSLMAPRQLSLSRRFGSHAGIILVETLCDEAGEVETESNEQMLRIVARIINNCLRDADVSARISHNQFIILCFIDNESNLDSLVLRLKKQFAKEGEKLNLVTGQSYFTPDTQIDLRPMQEQANKSLNLNRLGLDKKTR